ncbi:hypothetical protein ABT168_10825 [Streptomyces sp. NPDC001793]|uniref:hypothetical protein n=1 Tax=Streptomyces sp. NPDC001793 TaxID=3154657 RepID=UPI0033324F3B
MPERPQPQQRDGPGAGVGDHRVLVPDRQQGVQPGREAGERQSGGDQMVPTSPVFASRTVDMAVERPAADEFGQRQLIEQRGLLAHHAQAQALQRLRRRAESVGETAGHQHLAGLGQYVAGPAQVLDQCVRRS